MLSLIADLQLLHAEQGNKGFLEMSLSFLIHYYGIVPTITLPPEKHCTPLSVLHYPKKIFCFISLKNHYRFQLLNE